MNLRAAEKAKKKQGQIPPRKKRGCQNGALQGRNQRKT